MIRSAPLATSPYRFVPVLATLVSGTACAHTVESDVSDAADPAFDIAAVHAHADAGLVTFHMELHGEAGSVVPDPVGRLPGAKVASYAWPTNLDPSVAGFDADSGILALAITAHPDFDDTPLFDENADGDPANDGASWHSHWVVLVEDEACTGGLKVRDVSPGVDVLPPTAPGLPIALDSPGMSPRLDGAFAELTVPVADVADLAFDGVTAEFAVNEAGESPLLCVTEVHDVASGDLSLPGRLTAPK